MTKEVETDVKKKADAFDALMIGVKKALPLFVTSLLSAGTIVGGGVAVGAIPTNGQHAVKGIDTMQADIAAIKASVSVIPVLQTDVAIVKVQIADLTKRIERMEDRK